MFLLKARQLSRKQLWQNIGNMNRKTADEIIKRLAVKYPNPKPALRFSSDYELLVAVILSAQCTDERVNTVTSELFKEYNTPEKMLNLSAEELSKRILPCGLNNSKAAHILSASEDIVKKFSGKVPQSFEDLITLSGVGRKTADVMIGVAFNGDAIAVDTHVFRVSNRTGLAIGKTPYKVEQGLNAIIDKKEWSKAHHYLIFHGRETCRARKPDCNNCIISDLCEWKEKNK